jgi:hypothetical protein
VPNIPIDTPMSPPLYGVVQVYGYPVIDRYWNSSIAQVLHVGQQPNMYSLMVQLYRGGQELPASLGRPARKTLSQRFCQFWLGDPPPLPPNTPEPPDEQVKREAVTAVGWVYYEIAQIAVNGGGVVANANGGPPYEDAVRHWTDKNSADLQRELASLQRWLREQPN